MVPICFNDKRRSRKYEFNIFISLASKNKKEFIQDNAAQRPSYSVLDNEKILKDYDIVSSDIKAGIKNSLKNYLPPNKNDFK